MKFLGIKYPDPLKIFKKHPKPVLVPDKSVPWRSEAVFNPAVYIDREGKFKMIYRAIGEYYRYVSRFGLAISEDGVEFEHIGKHPVMIPIEGDEWWGVEDPRISEVKGKKYITYVKWNRIFTTIGIGEVIDHGENVEIKRISTITDPIHNKNSALIEINNELVIIHRPWIWGVKPSIWCSKIKKLYEKIRLDPRSSWVLFNTPKHLIKSGLGPQPLKMKNGDWLIIFHVVYPPEIYTVYVGLADKELKRFKSIIPKPVLVPEPDYVWEMYGDVGFVVFPSGAVVVDNELYLYYGAGDKVVMMAKADLSEILMYLDKYEGSTSIG